MLRLLLFAIIVFLVSLMGLTFISCQKEAGCDCKNDTATIATIFQPDGTSVKDAIIEYTAPDQNFGNTPLFSAFAWTKAGFFDKSRALIEFDLSSYPVNTYIKSAKLTLYWNSYDNFTDQTGENAFSIYPITQEWNENTVTWNNQPAVSDTNKVSVPKSTSSNQSYHDINVTNMIQEIITHPTKYHGLMVKLDDEIPYKLVVLASSDCADKSKRPKLVIYY